KVDQVRRKLPGPPPRVPADLAARAAQKGPRHPPRRPPLHRLPTCPLAQAETAFEESAAVEHPWANPPAETTPPLDRWRTPRKDLRPEQSTKSPSTPQTKEAVMNSNIDDST
ncbi:hypothetical protein PUR49_05265, partial [Streptomyces sp. BE147]|uniref:hypothetical protein n=1 Tax=Streptomyces sp. BE147 TaxID=3002524 RepID=UPI002E78EAA9